MRSIHIFILVLVTALGSVFRFSLADSASEIDRIVNLPTAPQGVVFEIAEGSASALQWAIPTVNHYARRLRERFPSIELAVVSHGMEMFSLSKDNQSTNPVVHQQVQSLVADDVPVHVCGNFAARLNKHSEDFPDYVDVAPAGPAQIKHYESLGYIRVEVDTAHQ